MDEWVTEDNVSDMVVAGGGTSSEVYMSLRMIYFYYMMTKRSYVFLQKVNFVYFAI